MNESDVTTRDRWVGSVLTLAVVAGMIAGLVELALLGVKRFGLDRTIRVSRDVFWMAPLADVTFCLVAALFLLAAAAVWRSLRRWEIAVGTVAFPALLTILLHYRPLHFWAKVFLALGLATPADVPRPRSGIWVPQPAPARSL